MAFIKMSSTKHKWPFILPFRLKRRLRTKQLFRTCKRHLFAPRAIAIGPFTGWEEGLRFQLCLAGSKNEGSAIKLSFKQQPFLTYQLDLLPPRSDGLQVKFRSTKFAVPEYKPACAPAAAPAISLLL